MYLQKRLMDVVDFYLQYLFQKRNPVFSIRDYQNYTFAALAGFEEVGFDISQALTFFYVFRPLIDESPVG